MYKAVLSGLAAIWLAIGPGFAAETGSFDLTIRGFKVGLIAYTAETTGRKYTVNATIKNTGLTRIMRQFSYAGSVQGAAQGRKLRPALYREVADTGKRQSSARMRYRNGTPVVESYQSARASDAVPVDPSTQTGSVDPLTAIYALLRDVPADAACDVSEIIFDGARQSAVQMRPAGTQGGLPLCAGFYERQKGFTADEIARHKRFSFTLSYVDLGGGLLGVKAVSFDSIYGKAAIQRR